MIIHYAFQSYVVHDLVCHRFASYGSYASRSRRPSAQARSWNKLRSAFHNLREDHLFVSCVDVRRRSNREAKQTGLFALFGLDGLI